MPRETPKINLIKKKKKIGGAKLQYQTKLPLKFHEIPLCCLGGVTDTRYVPPFFIYIAKSMLCYEKPQKTILLKYKIGGAQLQFQTKFP